MIRGFLSLLTQGAPEGALPTFLLEVFPCLDAAVAESPEEQVYFGNGFGVPDEFPDGWVGRNMRDVSEGVVSQRGGVGIRILPPASLIFTSFFNGGFHLQTKL